MLFQGWKRFGHGPWTYATLDLRAGQWRDHASLKVAREVYGHPVEWLTPHEYNDRFGPQPGPWAGVIVWGPRMLYGALPALYLEWLVRLRRACKTTGLAV